MLRIDDEFEANRLQCPRGHGSVGPTNNHWWCPSCARHWDDVDPEFDEVIDTKTGEKIGRDEVVLDYSVSGVNPA